MKLRGKKVTVVGLARSGQAVSDFLLAQGAKVSIADCQDNPEIRQRLSQLQHKNIVDIELGKHTKQIIKGRDLIVASPGVPLTAAALIWAKAAGIPVISEIELAYQFCPAPIIAITGTNGKTTVTTLIGEILRQAGKKSVVCGNIGIPFVGELKKLNSSCIVVLEVSSFQLETIDRFRPKAACLLNLTIDHLDRYASLEEYAQAKARIFMNQDSNDWAILNADDPQHQQFSAKTQAKIIYFSKSAAAGTNGLNGNHLAAIAVSALFGVDQNSAIQTCRNFKGLDHRLEEVAEIRGVQFINDSKATNVDSTLWALKCINRPIILIAGGKDKGSDYSLIKPDLKSKVKALILLGEAKEKIARELGNTVLTKEAANMPEAVKAAYALASEGDCVLLSPMCSSFDMFRDYTERGRVFKQIVYNLSNSKK